MLWGRDYFAYRGFSLGTSLAAMLEQREGLTGGDMVKSISMTYGPATSVAPAVDPASKDNYDAKGRLVASWKNAQYSFNLVRFSFTERFELIIFSKHANA